MRVIAGGLYRNCRAHVLGRSDLEKADKSTNPIYNGLHVDYNNTGSVTISWTRHDVRMNGNYWFEMPLSRGEIVRLLFESMREMPLSEVLRSLSLADRDLRREG